MPNLKNPGLTLKPLEVENPKTDKGFLRYKSSTDSYETILPDSQLNSSSTNLITNQAVANGIENKIAEGLPYLTTAPTADNTNGKIILVVLPESQKATTIQYIGYWYVFTANPPTP